MELAFALPPSKRLSEYAAAAETLGYTRCWVFDSPSVYGDLWVAITRAAEATATMKIAAGVAVPSMRHPMVTASAILTVEETAPGRVTCAFGSGYTARRAMGRKPMRWADVGTYYRQVRGLLDGDVVQIEGQPCQLLHLPDWGPDRPVSTPLWLSPTGPVGMAVAAEVDPAGLLLNQPPAQPITSGKPVAVLAPGTVLGAGEDHLSARVIEAAGPWYASMWHGVFELAPEHVGSMPGGQEWLDEIRATRPEGQLHLGVHEGHICAMTDRDRRAVAAGGPSILEFGWTGTPEKIRATATEAARLGVTEVAYSPAGPDIVGELERFAEAFAT